MHSGGPPPTSMYPLATHRTVLARRPARHEVLQRKGSGPVEAPLVTATLGGQVDDLVKGRHRPHETARSRQGFGEQVQQLRVQGGEWQE